MSVAESEFERKMQKIAAEIAPHLLPRRRDDQPLKEFKLASDEPEPAGMSGMAEVLAAHSVNSVRVGSHAGLDHMPDIGVYEQRCQTCGKIDGAQSDHQAAMLTAAGFGPVKEAQARAYDKGYTLGRKDGGDWRIRLGGTQGLDRRNPYRAAAVRGEG